MSMSGLRQFDNTIHKTNEWLQDVMKEMGSEDRQSAYHALRVVLHALRNRLTVEEAVDLAAQLPMLVRGFYYEGWQPAQVPVSDRTRERFLYHVREQYTEDFAVDAEQVVRSVFHVLQKHVSKGELDDIRHCLPEELKKLWD